MAVVASKGGAPNHPDWYLNLMAHPETTIQVWGDWIPVTARTATAAEKTRVWPTMTKEWPDYDQYQKKAEREDPARDPEPAQVALVVLHAASVGRTIGVADGVARPRADTGSDVLQGSRAPSPWVKKPLLVATC